MNELLKAKIQLFTLLCGKEHKKLSDHELDVMHILSKDEDIRDELERRLQMNKWYILHLNVDGSIHFFEIEHESDDSEDVRFDNMNNMGETLVFSRKEAESLFQSISSVLYGQEY